MQKKNKIYKWLKRTYYQTKDAIFPVRGKHNSIIVDGEFLKSRYDIIGNNNSIHLKMGCSIQNCVIYIRGNNNVITIEEGVQFYEGELWMEDDGGKITIGEKTTVQKAHLAVTENGQSILIGKDCMLSTGIEIRTGDSHSIIELNSSVRINPAASVILENHVWIGSNVSILKGVTIGNNSIIGTGSLVSKSILPNTLAVGSPAKEVKSSVSWKRERI